MKRLNNFTGAIALLAVMMTVPLEASAQENRNMDGKVLRGPYETNKFGDNWFLGAGGGINIFWNDGYGIKISPSIDANFGKWFTPAIGMRIGYQGLNFQGYANRENLQKFGYMYIHGDFLWNASDAIGGYKEKRFWDIVPYLHAGLFRSYGINGSDFYDNEFAAGAGILHQLRLHRRLDLIIDMRATVVNGRVIGNGGVSIMPTVTAGLAVDIGWPDFIRTSTIVGAVEMACAEKSAILEDAIIALEVANARLASQKNQLSKNLPQIDPTSFFEGMTPAAVYFNIGKSVLCKKEMEHLDFLAKNLISKVNDETNIIITVLGTADGNTGSMKRNEHLSEARGKYIFTILTTKYGIPEERIIIKNQIIKDSSVPELSRAAIISF